MSWCLRTPDLMQSFDLPLRLHTLDLLCGRRHQWFQTQTVVEVAVLAKNMTKERVDIHVDQQHLRVVIRDAEGEQEYELELDLYDQVTCWPSCHIAAGSPNHGSLG